MASSTFSCPGRLAAPFSRRQLLRSSANGFGLLALSALLADRAHGAGKRRHLTYPDRISSRGRRTSSSASWTAASRTSIPSIPSRDSTSATGRSYRRAAIASGSRVPGNSPRTARCGTAGQRAVSAHRLVRRRPGRHPLDEGRPAAALDGRAAAAHRRQQCRPAQLGLVGHLWPRQREPQPAGLRRAQLRRGALRRPGEFLQRISAGQLSGDALQGRRHADRQHHARRQGPSRPAGQARPAPCSRTRRSPRHSAATTPSKSAIHNYEMAYRMQSLVPDVLDLGENHGDAKNSTASIRRATTQRLYGIQCLRARRLVEAGVRFVEITCPAWRARTAPGTSTAT